MMSMSIIYDGHICITMWGGQKIEKIILIAKRKACRNHSKEEY